MTRHANELTKRATNATESSGPVPGIPGGVVRAWLGALETLGFDTGVLLAEAGLQRPILDDPDVLISCDVCEAIMARPQRETANLGLRMAVETPIGAYPLIDYLVVTSATVGQGITQLARYYHLTGAPAELEIRDEEDPVRVIAKCGGSSFGIEYAVSLIVLHLREETDGRLHDVVVSFAHRPYDVIEFERVLNCSVHVEAGWSGLTLSREA